VLSTDVQLFLYYGGLGFVALLGWAAIAQQLNEELDPNSTILWNRASALFAIGGLGHPALALIAYDIARQVARDQPEHAANPFVRLAVASLAISFCAAATFVAMVTR
jgi:hypothetical protein